MNKKNLLLVIIFLSVITSSYFLLFSKNKNNHTSESEQNFKSSSVNSSEVEIGRESKTIQVLPENNNTDTKTTINNLSDNYSNQYSNEQERINAIQPKEEELNSINQESEKHKDHVSVEDMKGETPILAPKMQ